MQSTKGRSKECVPKLVTSKEINKCQPNSKELWDPTNEAPIHSGIKISVEIAGQFTLGDSVQHTVKTVKNVENGITSKNFVDQRMLMKLTVVTHIVHVIVMVVDITGCQTTAVSLNITLT